MQDQRERASPFVVAVFNSTPDTVLMLLVALEHAGFRVVTARPPAAAEAVDTLQTFVREHRPDVVVFDVAPPYEAQWTRLEHFKTMPELAACYFVLTSTNKARIEQLAAGDAQVFAIFGTPYELKDLVNAVRDAVDADPPRSGA